MSTTPSMQPKKRTFLLSPHHLLQVIFFHETNPKKKLLAIDGGAITGKYQKNINR